jgi:tetratricopeptide (TPR) repeat protein
METDGSTQDDKERNTLLELLDGLPLAISQAGAYISESGLGLTKYLEFYDEQWSELMQIDDLNEAPLQDYSNRSVWTTWAISFNTIREKSKNTANLLLLWSFLDNKDMWFDMFAGASNRERASADMLSRWIGDIASSEVQFTQAMRLLLNYSLVEEITGTSSYATHPVVHQWVRHSQARLFELELCQLAVVVVGFSVPSESDVDSFTVQRRLLPHAQVCFKHIVQRRAFTSFDVEQGADEDDIHLKEQRIVLLALQGLGVLHGAQEKWVEAEEIINYALYGMKKAFGLSNEITLGSINKMAVLYERQGRLTEAQEMFGQALQGREKLLGPVHPSTLRTVRNLGDLYSKQRKLVEASVMCERALRGQEEVLGPTHISTLQTIRSLGVIYYLRGMLAEAEHMFDRALRGCQERIGEKNTQDYERTLRGYEKTAGKEHFPEHREELNILRNLGTVYREQGETAKAREVWEKALSGYSLLLGPSSDACKALVKEIEELSVSQQRGNGV